MRIDPAPFLAAPYHVTEPAPRELLRLAPASPVVRLGHTYRLPPDSATLVSGAFYPDLPFHSAVSPWQRSLAMRHPGPMGDGIDHVLDLLTGVHPWLHWPYQPVVRLGPRSTKR